MYSDMSTHNRLLESNMNSARARASSVLPTPWADEQEADRPVRVLQPGARAQARRRRLGLILADHALR